MPRTRNLRDIQASSSRARFAAYLQYLERLPYFQRRLEIAERLTGTPPRFLYKYKALDPQIPESIAHVKDIIIHSRLWLSSPKAFNDPFDMKGRLDITGDAAAQRRRYRSLAKEHGSSWKRARSFAAQMMRRPEAERRKALQRILDENLAKTGVCSLTGDPRNILMWSHYGGQHSGICLQFETSRCLGTLGRAIPVEYSETYPLVDWVEDFERHLASCVLRKYKGWEYEQEYRIVLPGQANSHISFAPDALVGILVGCRASPKVKAALGEVMRERESIGLPDFRIYSAEQHPERYQLRVMRTVLGP